MKKTFIVKRNDEFDYIGAVEKGAPDTFDPLGGMGTAHDCLEHFAGDTGSVDDEFQALGCIIYLRVDQGISRDVDVQIEMRQLYHHLLFGVPMKKAPRKAKPTHPVIEWIADKMEDFLIKEGIDDLSKAEDFTESFIYWANVGYKKAIKKYPSPYRTGLVFNSIQNEVDEILRHAEEGDEIVICYTKDTFKSCTHIGYYELEEENY